MKRPMGAFFDHQHETSTNKKQYSIIIKTISINMTKNIRRLLHGTPQEFDVFERTGVRSTSALGQGHYLTPSVNKAKKYGSIVMIFDVDVSGCLNWNRLTTGQRAEIEQFLIEHVPDGVVAKYGKVKYEVVPLNKDGLVRLRELEALTKHHESDSSRAKMTPFYELPEHLKGINRRESGVVRWREAGSLSAANVEQLLAVAQEYAPEIARHLGYQGAMFGDEIAIYDSKLAKKVGLLSEDNTFLVNLVDSIQCSENIPQGTNKVAENAPKRQRLKL